MSQQKTKNSGSMNNLNKIYQLNGDINESRARILDMMYNDQKSGTTIDKKRSIRIENLGMRINKLALMRHDEIMRVYSHVKISRIILPPLTTQLDEEIPSPSSTSTIPEPQPLSSPPRTRSIAPNQRSRPLSPIAPLEVRIITVGPNSTSVLMVTTLAKPEKEDDMKAEDIIYPEAVTDFGPYKTVARFRKALGQSTDFRLKPLLVGEDSAETLVLGLEYFAEQHGCNLSFTDEDQGFEKSIYRAAVGIVDLGSIHLLATDSMLTANFQFKIDLNYDNDITQSKENTEHFVLDFCEAISKVLSCDNSNVRVFSIDKHTEEAGKSQVNFGLTTPEPKRTEQLAHDIQNAARSGFPTDTVLRHVKRGEYNYTWKPVLTHLQVRPNDLDPRWNFDYRNPGVPQELTRANRSYYLPTGWYRHALKVHDKYQGGEAWLGSVNAEGEWSVAFHGTHAGAVSGIVEQGLLPSAVKIDVKRQEAVEQMGEEANQPGFYVATHCTGGSDIYTTPFTVTTFPDKSEQFRIVFQCRVQPGKFTTHTSPVNVGEAWRIVDRNAVRPYGILLKKEGLTEQDEEI